MAGSHLTSWCLNVFLCFFIIWPASADPSRWFIFEPHFRLYNWLHFRFQFRVCPNFCCRRNGRFYFQCRPRFRFRFHFRIAFSIPLSIFILDFPFSNSFSIYSRFHPRFHSRLHSRFSARFSFSTSFSTHFSATLRSCLQRPPSGSMAVTKETKTAHTWDEWQETPQK